jgi:hypothetical protein
MECGRSSRPEDAVYLDDTPGVTMLADLAAARDERLVGGGSNQLDHTRPCETHGPFG